LQRAFGKKAAAYWLERLDEAGIPCGPIQTVDQLVAYQQTRGLDILRTTQDGPATFVGLPVKEMRRDTPHFPFRSPCQERTVW
jgi:crotonobetainyl-CoA:carnitine CoA-transferase CaiB-like acyl-CoA transferase